MSVPLLGLLAALSLATGSVITKGVVNRLPARQLIGPLYALNALILLPFAPFEDWVWTSRVITLHLITVVVMIFTALTVFDLFDRGAASAVVTAQATSPLPAALAVAVLLPEAFREVELIAAVIVVVGVLWAISDSFEGLGRSRAMLTAAVAAIGGGLTTVLSRLVVDEGVGLAGTYVTRTAIAAVIFTIAIPPRDIPRGETPLLFVRALFISGGFAFAIAGVQRGSPTIIQTMVALTPFFVLGWETLRARRAPPPRLVFAAALALVGVALIVIV